MSLIQEKINQAVAILNEFEIDCWLTFTRESGINGDPALAFLIEDDVTWHSAFMVCRDGTTHAIVGKYDQPTIEALNVYDEVVGYVQSVKPHLQAFLQSKKIEQIAVNYSKGSEICDGLTMGMYLTLQDVLSEIGMAERLVSAEKVVSAVRERKSNDEIYRIQKAADITLEIWDEVAKFMKAGMTERQVADFVHQQIEQRGLEVAWDAAYCPTVISGLGIAEAHAAPTDKIIQKGEIVTMDFGVKYQDYVSDTQRTFYILKENETAAPVEVQHAFDTVVHAVNASKEAMKPKMLGHEIDKIARDIVVNAGFEEFPHGLGHQFGRFVHDGTALLGPLWEKYAEKPLQQLEENMVFTIEPRVKVPNRGIVSIEEMVVISKNGCEWITRPQTDLILIN